MKTKAKRLLALFLAIMMVLPITLSVSAADNADDGFSASSPSISDVSEILNLISYNEYSDKYSSVGKGKTDGSDDIEIDISKNVYVVDGAQSTIPVKEAEAGGVKDNSITVPEDRILLEAAIFADKCSITEELVRLNSHMVQLRDIINKSNNYFSISSCILLRYNYIVTAIYAYIYHALSFYF